MNNNEINGFQNEKQFCNMLNDKKVKDLNPMLESFISDLYGNLDGDLLIKCRISYSDKKYDIVLTIDNIDKRISIKKGIKNSVHVEGISSFIHFLIENNIERKYVINYLKYHYADGTTNGSGKKRISVDEYKLSHQKEIDELNKVLNKEELLIKAVERFVIKGNISDKEIDALVYGTIYDFYWIKKKDIYKIILYKKDSYSTAVHFSCLTVQPLDRCLNNNPKYEKRRFCIQIKWYNLIDDIIGNINNKIIEDTNDDNIL